MGVWDRMLRAGEGRVLAKLKKYAVQVNALGDDVANLTDAEIREGTDRFKARIADGENIDHLLPEAFAYVREAADRVLGERPYDVQLIGGAALHLGNIAEMKTGEGKTLVATLPTYLNALTGRGVHVITVNDFLASYQSELMGRVYRFLGLTTGCIVDGQSPEVRRDMYSRDITYGTNTQFGFDYLRDNMAWQASERVQRDHHYAIVDEVDSILIDEARTPLIISGPADGEASRWFTEFSKMAQRLKNDEDYEFDEKKRTVEIHEEGIERVEDYLGIENLYDSVNTPLVGFLNNAIKAKELYKRDKDYVVKDGEVMIVDEHTGRVLPGRRYNEGMHQAIEAKEKVEIKAENQTLATITLQNYFRLYDKLAGMTGTAQTEAAEFMQIYKLGVVPIPTNRPVARKDQPDLVYKNEECKFAAVAKDIAERHENGQPVLVGTTSVAKSEYLSTQLDKLGVPHEVLNAKQHEREAGIVAMAGRPGAVTVATNMAGRGTDIKLGGNPEFMAVQEMHGRGLKADENPEEYEKLWPEVLAATKSAVADDHNRVLESGGLYVLGTERHESRRIDNQLRGRSGRQGDPGESRFYLSMTDDLMRLFASGIAERLMTSSMPDDVPLESKMVSNSIQRAQTTVEGRNFEIRKNVLKYDDVMSRQREVIYRERAAILDGADVHDAITGFIEDVMRAVVVDRLGAAQEIDIDLDRLFKDMHEIYPVSFTKEDLLGHLGGQTKITVEGLVREFTADATTEYSKREKDLGSEALADLERRVLLSVMDRKWREHLYEMDYLQEGISLRAMAQKDPLVEFQREGFVMFEAMKSAMKEEVVAYLFKVAVNTTPEVSSETGSGLAVQVVSDGFGGSRVASTSKVGEDQRPAQVSYTSGTEDGGVETMTEGAIESGNRAQRRRAARSGDTDGE